MFTGIIEELAVVKSLNKNRSGARISVESKLCSADAKLGDSISVTGSCLTVVNIDNNILSFDISSETLKKSTLASIKPDDRVNLERSLRADSRLGGHFLTGHIDCVGELLLKKPEGEFIELLVKIPDEFILFVAEKGSIAIDGVSLTVNSIKKSTITLMIIPHTLENTTLKYKKHNQKLNIETDILAKYMHRFYENKQSKVTPPTSLSKNFLSEHGFV